MARVARSKVTSRAFRSVRGMMPSLCGAISCGSIVNASVLPSGENCGADSASFVVVIASSASDATSTTNALPRSSRIMGVGDARKPSLRPSGDQFGTPLTVYAPEVTFVAFPDATSTTQM